MHLWPAWVPSSRGLISQGDNRNTPLDTLSIKEKKVFVKTLNTAFLAELSRAKRASGAPWVRKFGKLSIR